MYWLTDNWKPILTGIAAVGLLGLFYVYSTSSAEAREESATGDLFKTQMSESPTAADYERIASDHSASGIAQHAKLRAAAEKFEEGNYADAEQAYNGFVGEFSESPLLPEAFLGIAVSQDAQGKSEEALTKYQEIISRFPQSAVINRAKLNQARLLKQSGQHEQAYRIYQEMTAQLNMDPYAMRSSWGMEARMALRDLIEAHPELVQTNAPAVNATASPSLDLPALTQ